MRITRTPIAAAAAVFLITVPAFTRVHIRAHAFWAQAASAEPGQSSSASSDMRSVWDGVYTSDQAKRGQLAYEKLCTSCHGDSLKGSGEASPLAGIVFLSNWNGLPVGDLFDRIRRSMPKNEPGTLGRQQTADILSYILSVNKFPDGKAELPRQSEILRAIRFEATRPAAQK